jgi:hypothetical protein
LPIGPGRPEAPPPARAANANANAAPSPTRGSSSPPPPTPLSPPPPPPPGLEGVLLPADSPLRTSAAAYSALLALAGGAARVKCGETALGRGLVVPRVPLPPVPATLPPLHGPAHADAAARAGAFRSPASSPTLAHPAVVTCTEDEDDEYEGVAAAAAAASEAAAAATAANEALDFGLEDYGYGGSSGGSSAGGSGGGGSSSDGTISASSTKNNNQSPQQQAESALLLRRGEVAVAVPLTSALVVTDEPLEGPSAVGDRQQAQWQIEHGALPEALADFLQQAGARWDVRMAAWVLWLAGEAREAAASGGGGGGCSPLWAHYLRLMPPPHELCSLLMYGRRDLDAAEEGSSSSSNHHSSLYHPSYTPTAWLQLPSLIAEADSQREWSEYMHDAYFAPLVGSSNSNGGSSSAGGGLPISAAAASGASARQLRALRGGKGLSPSRAASAWAQALVRSRSFSDDVGGEGLTLMVPFADLANHVPAGGGATFHLSRDGRAFHLRALRSVPSRSELTISYGERTHNAHLLRDYGFVVPANPYDRLDFAAFLQEAAVAAGGGGSFGGVVLPGGGGGGSNTNSNPVVDPSLTLNAASLLEYAGFGGDPNNEPDTVRPLSGGSSTSASAYDNAADALAKRQRLVRRRCVLLSLPTRNVSPHASPSGAGFNPASALFSWASSAAAPPPPLPLNKRDRPAERAAAAKLLAALDAQLASLATSARTDEDLLLEGRADVEGDGSLGGRARGGATRPLTPREGTAVRARLEHKRLLLEARAVLRGYDAWLSTCFGG